MAAAVTICDVGPRDGLQDERKTLKHVAAAIARSEGVVYAGLVIDTDLNISSFGEGDYGELYVVSHGGGICRLACT